MTKPAGTRRSASRATTAAVRPSFPLAPSPLLAQVSQTDLRALIRNAEPRAFRSRQVLFHRGDPPAGLYAIVSGTVRIVIQEPDGAELTLATFGVGEILGELAVLDGTPRSATAVAASSLQTLYIAADSFRQWLTAHPDVMWRMLAGLAQRLRSTNEQIAEIALLPIEARIARRLWQQCLEVTGSDPAPGLRLQVNQVAWAKMLGATRESINRQLSRLRAAGVIRREGNEIVLVSPDLLRAAAETV